LRDELYGCETCELFEQVELFERELRRERVRRMAANGEGMVVVGLKECVDVKRRAESFYKMSKSTFSRSCQASGIPRVKYKIFKATVTEYLFVLLCLPTQTPSNACHQTSVLPAPRFRRF
jgi:hypothetical protein